MQNKCTFTGFLEYPGKRWNDFTLDAGTVMIDGLLRLGAVLPEDRQYLDMLRLMKP